MSSPFASFLSVSSLGSRRPVSILLSDSCPTPSTLCNLLLTEAQLLPHAAQLQPHA